MDSKIELIRDWLAEEYTISELSRIHGVSRKTIYKWTSRYQSDPERGLQGHSCRPLSLPRATPEAVVAQILMAKEAHASWGARKLLARLSKQHPETAWPAASTVNALLKRHGLVHARRKRHHTAPYSQPFLGANQPNEVWCADYKGQFRLGSGSLCYPLTVTDSYSRYLLGCWGLTHPAYQPTRVCLERAFQEYGLPCALRTDNGTPFASVGLGGLSSLGVWLVKLGIRPERIAKGHPEQNGRHERMHRTLKAEAISPPRKSLGEQQRAFDRFQTGFNQERPHEALGQQTPAALYRRSARSYPHKLAEIEYASSLQVRQVKDNGDLKWQGRELYLSSALAGERVAFRAIDNGLWQVYFSFYPLGILDERNFQIT